MKSKARLWLIVVALILAASAFVLRISGADPDHEWWEIALPGIVTLTMLFLLISAIRERRGG